jgi:hypothetical protein
VQKKQIATQKNRSRIVANALSRINAQQRDSGHGQKSDPEPRQAQRGAHFQQRPSFRLRMLIVIC